MSGICGIVALGTGKPERSQLEAMTAHLERRGPDGTHHWLEGPVALGHTLLATTPEALVEVLPHTDPVSGCTITADVRLDNREELIAALSPQDAPGVIGDGELILRAYLRWGEACLNHLLGDFAFAIRDPRSDRLFCARDQMGMRQLTYYHAPGQLFVFATEPRAILTHEGVPFRINDQRISDFLEDYEYRDRTSTFYEGVYRLPPAHCLAMDANGLTVRRYWQLTPGLPLKLADDEAYAQAFLAVFTEAVRCRLRSVGPVGSMLSGGMDSGTIVAVASQILAREGRGPLQTFSATNPDPANCLETRTIQVASTIPGLAPHFVSFAELDSVAEDLLRLTQANAEPADGYMTLVRTVYLASQRAGIKVMLDGASGDVILTEGNFVGRLLRGGHILQAFRETQGAARFWGQVWPAHKAFMSGLWQAFAPWWLQYVRFQLVSWRRSHASAETSMLAPEFATRIDSRARMRAIQLQRLRFYHTLRARSSAEERAEIIGRPHLADGRERYDRVASAMAIEPRDPFLDLRVVQFCLSLPMSQLQRDGWLKIIVRRAMAGALPDAVRWRRGKQHLGLLFTQVLFSRWPDWWNKVFPPDGLACQFVARDQTRQPHSEAPGHSSLAPGFKLFYLENWLRSESPDHRDEF